MFISFQMNTLSMTLLASECLRKLGRSEDGLRSLAMLIVSEPCRLDCPNVTYDIYEQIPWSDWNTHWIQMHTDVRKTNPDFVSLAILLCRNRAI
jgi:hypothetical protein